MPFDKSAMTFNGENLFHKSCWKNCISMWKEWHLIPFLSLHHIRNYLKIDRRPESKSQYFKTHRSSCPCIRWWLTKITSNENANYVSWISSNFSTLGYVSRQQSSEKTTQNEANFCRSYKWNSKNSWQYILWKKYAWIPKFCMKTNIFSFYFSMNF